MALVACQASRKANSQLTGGVTPACHGNAKNSLNLQVIKWRSQRRISNTAKIFNYFSHYAILRFTCGLLALSWLVIGGSINSTAVRDQLQALENGCGRDEGGLIRPVKVLLEQHYHRRIAPKGH